MKAVHATPQKAQKALALKIAQATAKSSQVPQRPCSQEFCSCDTTEFQNYSLLSSTILFVEEHHVGKKLTH